jgi:hypothetical protein
MKLFYEVKRSSGKNQLPSGPHRKRRVLCIRCSGNVYTEPLPSNDRWDTHTDTQTDGRDLYYAVEMRAGAMIYKSSLIKIGSDIIKLIRRFTDIHTSHKPAFIFFFKYGK